MNENNELIISLSVEQIQSVMSFSIQVNFDQTVSLQDLVNPPDPHTLSKYYYDVLRNWSEVDKTSIDVLHIPHDLPAFREKADEYVLKTAGMPKAGLHFLQRYFHQGGGGSFNVIEQAFMGILKRFFYYPFLESSISIKKDSEGKFSIEIEVYIKKLLRCDENGVPDQANGNVFQSAENEKVNPPFFLKTVFTIEFTETELKFTFTKADVFRNKDVEDTEDEDFESISKQLTAFSGFSLDQVQSERQFDELPLLHQESVINRGELRQFVLHGFAIRRAGEYFKLDLTHYSSQLNELLSFLIYEPDPKVPSRLTTLNLTGLLINDLHLLKIFITHPTIADIKLGNNKNIVLFDFAFKSNTTGVYSFFSIYYAPSWRKKKNNLPVFLSSRHILFNPALTRLFSRYDVQIILSDEDVVALNKLFSGAEKYDREQVKQVIQKYKQKEFTVEEWEEIEAFRRDVVGATVINRSDNIGLVIKALEDFHQKSKETVETICQLSLAERPATRDIVRYYYALKKIDSCLKELNDFLSKQAQRAFVVPFLSDRNYVTGETLIARAAYYSKHHFNEYIDKFQEIQKSVVALETKKNELTQEINGTVQQFVVPPSDIEDIRISQLEMVISPKPDMSFGREQLDANKLFAGHCIYDKENVQLRVPYPTVPNTSNLNSAKMAVMQGVLLGWLELNIKYGSAQSDSTLLSHMISLGSFYQVVRRLIEEDVEKESPVIVSSTLFFSKNAASVSRVKKADASERRAEKSCREMLQLYKIIPK